MQQYICKAFSSLVKMVDETRFVASKVTYDILAAVFWYIRRLLWVVFYEGKNSAAIASYIAKMMGEEKEY